MMFRGLLAMLVANYRQTIDDDEARLYESELGHIPHVDLELAIRHAIRTRRFLPNVAELLEDLAAVRAANPAAAQEFEPCGECNAGWITVERRTEDVGVFDANGKLRQETRAGGLTTRRCDCWVTWRRSQGLPMPLPQPTKQIGFGVKPMTPAPPLAEGAKTRLRKIAGGKR